MSQIEVVRENARTMRSEGRSSQEIAQMVHQLGLTMHAVKSLSSVALRYAEDFGWFVVPVMGKRPCGGNGWQKWASNKPHEVSKSFNSDHDGVGVLLGPKSGIIDVECDDPEAEETLFELFDGTIPDTPTFQSTRGKHRLFRFNNKLPCQDKAVFKIGKLEFRTGNGNKGSQTVFPPSGPRYWITSPDECKPAEIPEGVLKRIEERVAKEKPSRALTSSGTRPNGYSASVDNRLKRARAWIAKAEPAIQGQKGSDKAFYVAVKMISFGLSRSEALDVLREEWNQRCVPPWSDVELEHKVDDAIKSSPSPMEDRPKRGSNKIRSVSNSGEESEPNENGEDDEDEEKAEAKDIDPMCEVRSMLAQMFTQQFGNESILKLRRWRGSFWLWNGTHFQEYSAEDVRAGTVKYLDQFYCNLTKTHVANVTLCLEAETNVVSFREMPSWLVNQRPDNWIAVRNGILNISALLRGDSNVVHPHTPNYFSANCLPYDFDPDAQCPKWLAFLNRNQEGDLKRISILQQYAGYCLSSSLSMHKFLFNEGEGANGKSVYCAGLAAMLGTINVSSVQLEQFGERFSLYQTLGKMANICAEIGEIDKVAEGVLKAFTSGDAMTFERKNRDPITSRPSAKLVFASNNRPHFSDKSGGLWRRMIVMPWRVTIPENERVRGMDTPQWWQEQGELPGILLWAIVGLSQLEQQGGFTKSEVCEAALDEYRGESNPARMFLEEKFRFDTEAWSPCGGVYSAYHDWAKASGFSPMSSNSFGHEIRRAFPRVEKREKYENGERFRAYFGLEKRP